MYKSPPAHLRPPAAMDSSETITNNTDIGTPDPKSSNLDINGSWDKKDVSGDKSVDIDQFQPVSGSSEPDGYSAPPNGGPVAWLQAAGAFFLFFNSWSVLRLAIFRSYQVRWETCINSVDAKGYDQRLRCLPDLL